jgi:hypothetical protein
MEVGFAVIKRSFPRCSSDDDYGTSPRFGKSIGPVAFERQ